MIGFITHGAGLLVDLLLAVVTVAMWGLVWLVGWTPRPRPKPPARKALPAGPQPKALPAPRLALPAAPDPQR